MAVAPVLTLTALLSAAAAAAPKPHIVYVLSDNLGHGNVGYLRARSPAGPSPEVVTPRIDELVLTGVELSRLCRDRAPPLPPSTFHFLPPCL